MKILIQLLLVIIFLCCANFVSKSAIPVSQQTCGVFVLRDGTVQLERVKVDSLASFIAVSNHPVLGIPRRAFINNNRSRDYLNAEFVLPGSSHKPDIIPYTGKGVVLGIIDAGIDPNHITFYDEDGNLRVKKYIFTSSSVEEADGEFRAIVYDTPEAIAAAPPDRSEGGHGTHTAATAAGSWRGNPYHGVAPGTELIFIGTGQAIYDDEIIYGMQAVSDYAVSVGKSAVMSLSLGSGHGPRDGTSPIGLVSKKIAQRGHHIFFSAGNDGKRGSSITRNFSVDTTAVRSMFQKYYGGPSHVCWLEAWSRDQKEAEFQIILCHRDTVKYMSRWITPQEVKSAGGKLTLLSDSISGEIFPEARQWMKGEIFLEMGVYAPNNRFHLCLDADIKEYGSGELPYFAFGIRSPQGADMRIYTDAYYNTLVNWGNPDFLNGTPAENISDFAASPDVISVGMMNAVNEVTTLEGTTLTLSSMKFGELDGPNLYSSYGTTLDGETLPLVSAPGTFVISALYPEAPGMESNYVVDTIIHGKRYVWGHDSGTSMSSPAVAGTVALWLEAVPTLTHEQLIDVLKNSSNRTICEKYPYHCAYGIPDAYSGLKYAIDKYSAVDGINVDRPNKLSLRFLDGVAIVGSSIECLVSKPVKNGIAEFYSMDGRKVKTLIFKGVSFATSLPTTPGVYILKVSGEAFSASQKILVSP